MAGIGRGVSPVDETARRPSGRGARVVSAGIAPLALGAASVAVSLGLAVAVATGSHSPILFFGVPLPLADGGRWWLNVIGYLLTPIGTIACYGWDAIAQRDGRHANPNGFVARPAYTTALLWLAGAGVLIGVWHVLNLSVPLSEAWA